MKEPSSQKNLQKALAKLKNEQLFKQGIIDCLHTNIVIFNAELNIQTINAEAQSLLNLTEKNPRFFAEINFFKNKKQTIDFKIESWLRKVIEQPSEHPQEDYVWVVCNQNNKTKLLPLLISAKLILTKKGQFQGLLLSLYDRSNYAQIDEQNRILKVAFNSHDGQFITNEKGYIIKPNSAFSGYTGLLPPELKKISFTQWLKQQVTFKNNASINDVLKSLATDKFWSGEVEIHPSKKITFYSILSLSMLIDKEHNIEHYIGRIHDITAIKEAQARIKYLAYYDGLTGLPNRSLLIKHIDRAIPHHKRNSSYSALMYIDLDNFKEVNDVYGHLIGDKVLKYTAKSLKSSLRAEDIIARISGDEFIVLTQSSKLSISIATQHAFTLSNKLLEVLSKDIGIDDITIPSSISIGVCIFPVTDDEIGESLISQASLAMHEAKKAGRNQVYLYNSELTAKMLHRRKIEIALKNSNYNSEFYLAFQPQISTNNDIISAEALIRWEHPVLGIIPPNDFIKIAEDNREILKIGYWVLRTAFIQVKQWNINYNKEIHLAINISPVQFHQVNFVEDLIALQNEIEILPQWITLEMTEGVLIANINEALEKIKALNNLGYKLSIDDFGTGYSSLKYLQKLPIHELKIDRSFVQGLPNNLDDASIVKVIMQLAASKNLIIVAEGIETIEQAEFFTSYDSSILLQGYFYSKPVEAKIFANNFLETFA